MKYRYKIFLKPNEMLLEKAVNDFFDGLSDGDRILSVETLQAGTFLRCAITYEVQDQN